MGEGKPWWRLPVCWMEMCAHRPASDETGCWGECVTCHQRVGFVSRELLRAYADMEAARQAFIDARITALKDHAHD